MGDGVHSAARDEFFRRPLESRDAGDVIDVAEMRSDSKSAFRIENVQSDSVCMFPFRPMAARKNVPASPRSKAFDYFLFWGSNFVHLFVFFFSSVHRREPLVRTERTRSWLLLLLLLLLLSVVQRPIKGRTRASRDPPQRSRFLRRRWSHGDTAGYINLKKCHL